MPADVAVLNRLRPSWMPQKLTVRAVPGQHLLAAAVLHGPHAHSVVAACRHAADALPVNGHRVDPAAKQCRWRLGSGDDALLGSGDDAAQNKGTRALPFLMSLVSKKSCPLLKGASAPPASTFPTSTQQKAPQQALTSRCGP